MKAKKKAPARKRTVGDDYKPQRILVPTDFSYPAEQALKHALAIARRNRAEISLIHVVSKVSIPDMVFASTRIDLKLIKDLSAERMERLAKRFKLKPAHQVVCDGNAAEEVVKFAEKIKADLLVISSRGHTALERMVIGSTAERIVHFSTCPVLVIPIGKLKTPAASRGKRTKQ